MAAFPHTLLGRYMGRTPRKRLVHVLLDRFMQVEPFSRVSAHSTWQIQKQPLAQNPPGMFFSADTSFSAASTLPNLNLPRRIRTSRPKTLRQAASVERNQHPGLATRGPPSSRLARWRCTQSPQRAGPSFPWPVWRQRYPHNAHAPHLLSQLGSGSAANPPRGAQAPHFLGQFGGDGAARPPRRPATREEPCEHMIGGRIWAGER